jgi:hypothetical protein
VTARPFQIIVVEPKLAQRMRHAAVDLHVLAHLDVVRAAGGQVIEIDVACGRRVGAGGADASRHVRDVAPRVDFQRAGGSDDRLAGQRRIAAIGVDAAVGLRGGQRFVAHVARDEQQNVTAADGAALVEDVLVGIDVDAGAGDERAARG